jgi:hypothetical protein
MSDYEVLLGEYFELKTKYEEEYRSKKAGIVNKKDLSKKQKRKLVESIKMKCVGCKRPVGTTFYDKDRTYGAICGDVKSPCGLNIQIKKQSVLNINEMIPDFDTEISNNEFNIKKMKLYLLFGLIDEEELIKFYETEKEEYNSNSDFKRQLEETLEAQTNMTHRNEQIKELKMELQQEIKDLKDNMRDYLVNENREGLTNASEIYVENITTILDKLRNNKYVETIIEKIVEKQDEMPKIMILNKINTATDYEIIVDDGEIIHFEK